MKRSLMVVVVLAALPLGKAAAQQPSGQPSSLGSPYVSPYLNLARPGNAGINYYGLVRPQQQTDAFIQQQLALQQANPTAGVAAETNGPLTTGTTVRFMSQGTYFGTIRPTPVAPLPVSGLTNRSGTH
jgi:hypothetical protein